MNRQIITTVGQELMDVIAPDFDGNVCRITLRCVGSLQGSLRLWRGVNGYEQLCECPCQLVECHPIRGR